jgi:FlaA1/EpsC-like NDP-sugar epimerase
MNILRRIIYGSAPKTAVIKVKAHLFTLLAAFWILFTIMGVVFFTDRSSFSVRVALILWLVHAALIALSIYFWITERPKPVLFIGTDGDGDGGLE